MTHQEGSVIVPLPVAIAEQRLAVVEAWDRFLHGVSAVTKTAHERYLFHLDGGRVPRDVPVVCRARPREHRFRWRSLTTTGFEGSIQLTALDDRQTKLTVATTMGRPGFLADCAEMLRLDTSTVVVDLSLLSRHLLAPVAGKPPQDTEANSTAR